MNQPSEPSINTPLAGKTVAAVGAFATLVWVFASLSILRGVFYWRNERFSPNKDARAFSERRFK